MNKLAVIALATLLSGVAFGQIPGKVVDIDAARRGVAKPGVSEIDRVKKETVDRLTAGFKDSRFGGVMAARVEKYIGTRSFPQAEVDGFMTLGKEVQTLIDSSKTAQHPDTTEFGIAARKAFAEYVGVTAATEGATEIVQVKNIIEEANGLARTGNLPQAIKLLNASAKKSADIAFRASMTKLPNGTVVDFETAAKAQNTRTGLYDLAKEVGNVLVPAEMLKDGAKLVLDPAKEDVYVEAKDGQRRLLDPNEIRSQFKRRLMDKIEELLRCTGRKAA